MPHQATFARSSRGRVGSKRVSGSTLLGRAKNQLCAL